MVIGLEVHVELKTRSKIFCSCDTTFGQKPNTQTCPVCLGLPGSLPVLNEEVIHYGIKAGLATGCKIALKSKQDRKNYFYPDLAKAYQISQYDQPLCEHGKIVIHPGYDKTIGITRIHLEEDAGKLIHHPVEGTLIDYNRAGVPLIEIVSEPDISSALEAKLYLQKLRGIILYTGISDCKMNEGSFRVDVNLSVRKKGEKTLGTRTEMKNLNSFSSVAKAIENEYLRQIKVLETGGTITQETRKWDQEKNKSIAMRTKEDAHDYRYFPDPDLSPIVLSEQMIEGVQLSLPELPDTKVLRYIDTYKLSKEIAEIICIEPAHANYFEATVSCGADPVVTANLMTGEIFKQLDKIDDTLPPFTSEALSELVQLIERESINISIGKKVLQMMFSEATFPKELVEREQLYMIKDEVYLSHLVDQILDGSSKILEDYQSGKAKALQALIGQVMKETKGLADPGITEMLIKRKISK
ncbi:MAG: Asp-tRNA(Asn)/Glu-tRNA(Gln) amidotransferase subunit GatB [Clostridia bacterium]|nr:Asp-tRNA(Asn)/Glu-tRNA(Gln) amidotransferase subunit GatB [Clostridia bacterium]